jgi:hypothetical protein
VHGKEKQREEERDRKGEDEGEGEGGNGGPYPLGQGTTAVVACIPAEIDGGHGDRQVLAAVEKMTGRRAGLGPVWAVIYCPKAADKREIREDLGRIWPGEKERFFSIPSFLFLFLCFQNFCTV